MQNIKAYLVDKANHEPLGHKPSNQTFFNYVSANYVQEKQNPQYNKIILHASDQNDAPASKLVFYCSIGCCLGFEIGVVDANNEGVDFSPRWSCSGPFLTQIIQKETRARAHIIKAGQQIGTNKKVDFGWCCAGSFTLCLEALMPVDMNSLESTLGRVIASLEFTVIVSEPSVEKLSIEMPIRPDGENDANRTTSLLELGPVSIVSCINAGEVSGTFGFVQATQMFLERSCSDGSKQVIQTPKTFTTMQTMGIEKRVINEAQHVSCSEKKTLTTEYMTDFNKMFEKPECMGIEMKNKFQTFVVFQPDVDCFPGVTKSFIVKYTQDYLEWEWNTNAIRDDTSWKFQNTHWQSDEKSESERWRPVDWTKTADDKIVEENWTPKKQIIATTT